MRSIISDKYAGKTNRAFAEALKRLVHFAKAEEIGEKKDGRDYVPRFRPVPCIRLRIGQDGPTPQVLLSRCLVSTIVRGFALEDVGPKSPESGFSTEQDYPEPCKTFRT